MTTVQMVEARIAKHANTKNPYTRTRVTDARSFLRAGKLQSAYKTLSAECIAMDAQLDR